VTDTNQNGNSATHNAYGGKAPSVSSFLEHHFRHFNARETIDAAKAYKKFIDDGGKMMVTLAGLRVTAIEKICAKGLKDAKEEVKKIRDVYCDIVRFWKFDKKLIDEFENRIKQLKKMNKEGL